MAVLRGGGGVDDGAAADYDDGAHERRQRALIVVGVISGRVEQASKQPSSGEDDRAAMR